MCAIKIILDSVSPRVYTRSMRESLFDAHRHYKVIIKTINQMCFCC
jgi:hypothetical protein